MIKVERPEGDLARGDGDVVAGGQSNSFVWLNRGKESHVLDLTGKDGRRALRERVAGADVLGQNLKRGALDRMGLAVEDRCREDLPGPQTTAATKVAPSPARFHSTKPPKIARAQFTCMHHCM